MNKNQKKIKVLCIGNKWRLGDYTLGPSEWDTYLWQSLKSTEFAQIKLFHFDDYYFQHKERGDKTLTHKIYKYKPNIICLIVDKIPDSHFTVPKYETLNLIKKQFKIPIMTIWGDLEIDDHVKMYRAMLPYTSINGATASSAAIKRINNQKKCIYLWVPRDPTIFNNPHKKRDIDLSFVGSLKGKRYKIVNYLIKNNIDLYSYFGMDDKRLTTKNYAEIFKRSKITLSFSRNDYSHVINARPFEAMNCGAMVLEQENFETPKLFIPYVDYIPYKNKRDLLNKIKYYLEHDKEREKIAENGYKKVTTLYTSKRFWKLMINRSLKKTSRGTENLLFLKQSNLVYLTQWEKIKLTSLDILCSNKFSNKIYRIIAIILYPEGWKGILFHSLTPIKKYLKKYLPSKTYETIHKTTKLILNVDKWEETHRP